MTADFRKQIEAKPPRLIRRAELRRIVPLAAVIFIGFAAKLAIG